MCGRFTLRASADVIAEQFAVFEMPPFSPRFNIAPSQPILAVRATPTGRELTWLRWGLIPGWAKDPAIGNRMINARAETVAEKPAYRAAMRRRRCLVPADGFYEWQKAGRTKRPHLIHMKDDRPFAMAGLWEAWEGPDDSYIESCTILTTGPNELVRLLHDRMPVILDPADYQQWLDPKTEDATRLTPLLRPYPSERMKAQAVGTLVNNPANDEARCIEPERDLFS